MLKILLPGLLFSELGDPNFFFTSAKFTPAWEERENTQMYKHIHTTFLLHTELIEL